MNATQPEIVAESAIGEAAARFPALIAVFDRFGLDYCCQGHHSLAEACRHAGADVRAVLAAATETPSASPSAADPVSLSLTELCDEIEKTHHTFVRHAFQRLGTLLPRVLSAHGAEHPRFVALDEAVRELRDDMTDHMVREERVLFPWLRRLERREAVHVGPPWSVRRPIDCMIHDHDAVADLIAWIRSITTDYTPPAGCCGSVATLMSLLRDLEADTRIHIHKENNILFPRGVLAEVERARPEPKAQCFGACGGTCR
jgi:regulator of cell morphogenesis and NO signaling